MNNKEFIFNIHKDIEDIQTDALLRTKQKDPLDRFTVIGYVEDINGNKYGTIKCQWDGDNKLWEVIICKFYDDGSKDTRKNKSLKEIRSSCKRRKLLAALNQLPFILEDYLEECKKIVTFVSI